MPREVASLEPRAELPALPGLLGARRSVVLAIALAFAWAWVALGLSLRELVPDSGGLALAGDFLARALTPALSSEARFVPAGSPPLLWVALEAALHTIGFAAAAMGLALVLGLVLGFCASTAWWAEVPSGGARPACRALRRAVGPIVHACVRTVSSVMRSIHELLWAVLFLSALGLSEVAAVLAIALPTAGILGKVFAELIDEAPRGAARALRASGATGAQVFFFALLPRAFPEMISYSFYRFECALRSSAILGFFGFPTLGLYLRQSFLSTNYGEVWTYLYVLVGLVLVFDAWSGALRRRIVR